VHSAGKQHDKEEIMALTEQSSCIKYQHGGGWLGWIAFILIGLPGLAIMAMAPFAGPHVRQTPLLACVIFFLFGLGMAAFGVAMAFGRWKKVIDPQQADVLDQWMVFGFGKSRHYPLDSFTSVRVGHRTVSSRSGARYSRYTVVLSGQKEVYLTEYSDPDSARQDARRVAAMIKLPVEMTAFDTVANADRK
jgi:hypothetical protein